MMRNRFLTLFSVAAAAAMAQAPAAKPQFEVATIKLSPPLNPAMAAAGKLHIGMNVDAARADIGYLSLADLIMAAYKVKQHQVAGPDWMKTQRFDILAKMPEGATKEQLPEMLQGLLAERFGLTFHKEMREQPVYALVVAKGGPKLKESSKEEEPAPKPDEKGGNTINFGGGQIRQSGNTMVVKANDQPGTSKMSMVDGKMRMESTQVKMPAFAEMLTRFVGKPVVDMTELKGSYDTVLELSMAEMMVMAQKAGMNVPGMMGPPAADSGRPADAASDPTASGSIFASIQQLGLKLETRKVPVDTIVVDKLEKMPTEN
jgi:uncharacterized protein (TIGR03435 family)